MKIYLAGPFFNETEVRNIEYAEQVLKEKGLVFNDVLIRKDDVFEYLNEKTANFRFHQEQADVEIEDEKAVYEDERILGNEDEQIEEGMAMINEPSLNKKDLADEGNSTCSNIC